MEKYITECLHVVGTNSECKFLLNDKLRNGVWQIACQSIIVKFDTTPNSFPVRVSTNLCEEVITNIYAELRTIETTIFQFNPKKSTDYEGIDNPTIVWHDVTHPERELEVSFTNSFDRSQFSKDLFKVSVLILMRRIK